MERRGSMYDPLIVDTFIRVHAEIAPEAHVPVATESVLMDITSAAALAMRDNDQQTAGLENITAGSDEMRTMFDLTNILNEQSNFANSVDAVASQIRRLVPFALAIFFTYDDKTDEIVATYSVGEGALLVRDMRIAPGQRLSGWVAANRQSIVNSDAVLDLGEIAKTVSPRLRTCLSTPLIAQEQLVGVMTVYSSSLDGFSDNHRRLVETAAKYVAPRFRQSGPTSDNRAMTDSAPATDASANRTKAPSVH
jgi:transcriptional regulator with GAF, ATPase, and Fis domain